MDEQNRLWGDRTDRRGKEKFCNLARSDVNFDGYDLCFGGYAGSGGSGGSVSVVSLVPVVPFRWFRWFRSGGFVPLFRVLPHAAQARYNDIPGLTI